MNPVALPATRWEFDPADWPDADCVGAGADLEPGTIIAAYSAGAFPMPHEGQLLWWSPMVRGVLEPGHVHISRSLRRSMRSFHTTMNLSFVEVIDACADPSRPGAWIDDDIRAAYIRLHELGWAHSVEVRNDAGELQGGLYGLKIGRLFAGESMFHWATDASKAAMVQLARWMGDDSLVDVQWQTPHLSSMGVATWSRARYLAALPALIEGR